MSAPVKGRPYWKAANDVAQFVGVEIHVEDDGSIHVEGDEGFDTDCGPAKDSAMWDRRIADAVATLAAVAVKCGDHYCPLHDDGGFGPTLKPCTCEDDEPDSPVPVPVVNEITCDQCGKSGEWNLDGLMPVGWLTILMGGHPSDVPMPRRFCSEDCLRAKCGIEAQAKLEALDADVVERWAEYRLVIRSGEYEFCSEWTRDYDTVLGWDNDSPPDWIVERRSVSASRPVRPVEEGGES